MIVVCGEALFDVFDAGKTPTGLALDARVGGSPFNVAVGLARLGRPVCLLTQISKGFLGERLMQALASEGVDTSTVQRSDAPTTLSLVGLDAQGVPSYAFYGTGCADRLMDIKALDALPAGVEAVNFGSYATVTGETARTQRALVERLHGSTLIAYDPNIRLNVEPDLSVWQQQIDWMLPRTHLFKSSEEDIELVYPGRTLDDVAAQALAAGATLVVVTRGGKGALGWTREDARIEVPPVKVDVIDTVGAGDTFQAAMLTWLAEHGRLSMGGLRALTKDDVRSLLSFATSAAAITCSRRGADLPRRSELA